MIKRKEGYAHNRGKSVVRYPWDNWLVVGTGIEITKGYHYHCETHGMANMIRNEASRRKLSVSLRIKDDTISIKTKERRKK